MIGIVDYGMGNLRSVQKALQRLGADAEVVRTGGQLDHVERLVLPGVGAFADGMSQLGERGLIEPLRAYAASGRPFLGVCLGMQLLFDSSEEDAPSPAEPVPGLGIVPGRVVRFQEQASDGRRLKVPHMGWNTLSWDRPAPLLAGLGPGVAVYFVHSYYVRPDESPQAPLSSATSEYGQPFCAAIWRDNIEATQFHPEKSQRVGLRMLKNFAGREATEGSSHQATKKE